LLKGRKIMNMYLAMERELLVVRQQQGKWQAEAHLVGMQPTCVSIDPLRPERVYCGTFGRGLWRSSNAGRSWEPVGDARSSVRSGYGEGIPHPQLTSVAVSLTERSGGYGVVYAGTEPTAVYRSEDGSNTWWELKGLHELASAPTWRLPDLPSISRVRWITPDPSIAGRLFVAIEAGALIKSQDGGKHWEDRQPEGPLDTHTLLMHQQLPNRLYSAAGDGFLYQGKGYNESYDGGKTWQHPDEGLQHHYLWGAAIDPANPDTVVVSAAESPDLAHSLKGNVQSFIYRKTSGQPWRKVTQGLPDAQGTVAYTLTSNCEEPGVFYALSNKGCYRSADTGQSWAPLPIPWKSDYEQQRQQALAISNV
jgi:hypothetical protein